MCSTQPKKQLTLRPCQYKVGKPLGAGSYATVKECVNINTGKYYAAKIISKRFMAGCEHVIRNEIGVLKRVSMGHKNIISLVDYFETTNNVYLITDLALGGDLFDRICRRGCYYESDAASLIASVVSAITYLHDNNIVHRDLKPENLLFRTPEDNADLLVADFGLSRFIEEEQLHVLTTTCGTPGYMAPEIFTKSGYGKPVDIWAIGVITFLLLSGCDPFSRDNAFDEIQAVLDGDYSFKPDEHWRYVSANAQDFICQCLTVEPSERLIAQAALKHPFIANSDEPRTNTSKNLLPIIKKALAVRRAVRAATDIARYIKTLRESQIACAGPRHDAECIGTRGHEEPASAMPLNSKASADVAHGEAIGLILRPGTLVDAVQEKAQKIMGDFKIL